MMKKTSTLRKTVLSAMSSVVGCAFALAQAQQAAIPVTGVVSDAKGPVPGVTVMVKGSQMGTVTDATGNFSIKVPDAKSVLSFSFVGYKSQEIVVGAQRNFTVVLEEDAIVADEVVVVGYGVQQKSHLTGSISKLDGETLIDRPLSDVTQALQGMIGGLTINNTTSEVGEAPEIRVRGLGSINANSEPLVVIDGIPVPGGLQMLNSSDILSIEVLKDAASAAIYGSRAANGVIMVTTKSGAINKPKYTVKVYSGMKYAYKLHDLMNSQEYRDWQNMNLQVYGSTAVGAYPNAQTRAAAWIEENIGATDWQREGLRDFTGITNVQFSVSGGRSEARYYTSASYTKDQGLMWQNEVQKVSVRTKYDAKLSKFVDMGVNFVATYSKSEKPDNNFINFYRTPSFMPVQHNAFTTGLTGYTGWAHGAHFNNILTPTNGVDVDGNPIFEKSSPFSSNDTNPRSIMANTFKANEAFQGVGSVYLNIKFAKDFLFKTANSFNVRFAPATYYMNKGAKTTSVSSESSAIGRYSNTLYVDLLTENTLNYTKKIKKHDINALVGYTLQKTRNENAYIEGTNFPTDDIHTLNAATQFTVDQTGTYKYPDLVLESFLGRVMYSYNDRYLLSASMRLDRSSLFMGSNKNAWFPSVSLGWRVSEEDFMKSVRWISSLKLRGSYGVTGNNGVSHLAALNTKQSANYPLGTGNGSLTPGLASTGTTLGNSDLTWEQTDEYNAGLDLGMLNNRINISFDAYYSITRALLLKQNIQSFTGYSYGWNNIGKIRNKGLELTVDSYNIRRKNFEWNTSFNVSMTRNRLLDLGGEAQFINYGERQEAYLNKVGSPLIQFYAYKTMGNWNSADEIAANPHFASGDAVGGFRIYDADNSGYLNSDDRVVVGSPYPKATYGMTNTFRYKNFDLSFLIQGVAGVQVLNGDIFYTETLKWNKKYNLNAWVSPTHQGDGRSLVSSKPGFDMMLTNCYVENASYVSLRNATLGYTFSKKTLGKLNISALRLYVAGNNLAYIWSSNYRGVNPESRFTSTNSENPYYSPFVGGYQRGGFPITSTVTFGIDITF